jgi:hypothetical protein
MPDQEDFMTNEDGEPVGVLGQHRKRMAEDPAYREAALTPPGNHPPGGHVDDVQRTADGEPAAGE